MESEVVFLNSPGKAGEAEPLSPGRRPHSQETLPQGLTHLHSSLADTLGTGLGVGRWVSGTLSL